MKEYFFIPKMAFSDFNLKMPFLVILINKREPVFILL